jgi:hypothetical protein
MTLSKVSSIKCAYLDTKSCIHALQEYLFYVKPHASCNYMYFESFTVATMNWLTVMEYLCHR